MKQFGLWLTVCCMIVFTLAACGNGGSSHGGTSIGSKTSKESKETVPGAGEEKDSDTGGKK
ncbi:hypothetical protein, partial [Moraxella catarrhalis]